MRDTPRSYLIWMFCVLAAVQVWVPLSMIARREAALRHGEAFKFRTRPVDPYDAFRGRYVALQFESNEASATNAMQYQRGQSIYVPLETDKDGYATLGEVNTKRPREGAYLKTRVHYYSGKQSKVRVRLPFDRYYMNEKDAPEAERRYWRASRREERKAHALVRVRGGMAVIEDLYIEDLPILEYMKRKAEDDRE